MSSTRSLASLSVLTALLIAPLSPLATSVAAQGDGKAGAAKTAPQEKKEKAPKKLAPAIALVRFSGAYADLAEGVPDITAMLLGGGGAKPKPFYDLVEQLAELGAETSTKTVLFDFSSRFSMNLAQLAEMERSLRELRKTGKKLFAYIESAGSTQMQLAAQCDKVIMADMGVVEIPSVSLSVTFMKDALDLLGVKMDVIRCGDFKGAVEPYVLSRMSKHLRKHYLAMLGKINDDIVQRIASGRGIAQGKVRQFQERRILTAKQALEAGLVDELVPWIGATRAFAKVASGGKTRFRDALAGKKRRKSVNFFSLMSNMLNPKAVGDKIREGLVVLHLSGGIVDGDKASPGSIVSGPTVKEIRRIQKDSNVKAVVVRINSPGGSATASEAILLALKDLVKVKPVAFSMGRVAASGGYYVTCAGRPIFAEVSTITGSIGVFGMKPSLGALMRRVGVHEEIVALDEGAGFASLSKSWTSEQKEVIQGFINEVYDRFTAHVAASREIPVSDVLRIAGGRVWSGEQARDRKLVDHIGGLQDAMDLVAREAKLGDDYDVTHLPEPVDVFSAMMRDMMGVKAMLSDPTLRVIAKKVGGLENALRILVDAMLSDKPTKVWAMMPEVLRLR